MTTLRITEFGDPVLRHKASLISPKDIKSSKTQSLVKSMQQLLVDKKLGVGLAAPQIGQNMALAVVAVRPTKYRPKVEPLDLVIINPRIVETVGRWQQKYEGCISGGPGKAGLFAKVPRYKKIKLKYYDEAAKAHEKYFEGLPAQVIQHEVDHLNGVLFVDRVKDAKSYMTYKEYLKYAKAKLKK